MEQEEKYQSPERSVASACVSIIIYLVSFGFLSAVLLGFVYVALGNPADESLGIFRYILLYTFNLVAAVVPAVLLLKFCDRLPLSDLGLAWRGHGRDVLWGAGVALLLFAAGFGLSCGLGAVEVTGVHFRAADLAGGFVFFIITAFMEEIMVRGYILGRLLHTRMNKFLALFLSSLIFSALHLFNPNVAFLPLLNIVLAGCMLGSAFLYTRNLWFPISLHLFWNWIQGPVLGYEVSGSAFCPSLLELHLPENNLINGGAFGFEGSILCTFLVILVTGLIIWHFERRKAV